MAKTLLYIVSIIIVYVVIMVLAVKNKPTIEQIFKDN